MCGPCSIDDNCGHSLKNILLDFSFSFVAITIGMDVNQVIVNEDVGMTELCASAVGDLEQDIVVSVVYQDRGGIGKCSIVAFNILL